ncbi:MAG: hypothetical protein QOG77_1033 [Solirubrobacteraceae bacterium]|jgi:hypothetical protein|nr:hypothetical protein [Solirubrobacteraceae bacterium]
MTTALAILVLVLLLTPVVLTIWHSKVRRRPWEGGRRLPIPLLMLSDLAAVALAVAVLVE